MKAEPFIRILAGTMILISVALTLLFSAWWLLLTCFVAINLIQSAFTRFCPAEIIAKRTGLIEAGSCGNVHQTQDSKHG
ncbi:MAG: DUF2892 domain-containing protein [Opitutales bacterium]|nr:DUF2892 domain-containing protein [Opitutales bacterium]